MRKGISVSEGIGIGTVYKIKNEEISYTPSLITDVQGEIERLKSAVDEFCRQTNSLAEEMSAAADEKNGDILRGHVQMICDPYMKLQMEEQIRAGCCGEKAAETVIDGFIELFSSVDDELTRQRAADVADIKNRLLKILLGIEERDLKNVPKGSIIVTEELTPSMTAGLNADHIEGIITETGGKTSHSAILARALEIPAVLSVVDAVSVLENGSMVIVDGGKGQVITKPGYQQLAEYEKAKNTYLLEKRQLQKYMGKETLTSSGEKKEIYCNIGTPADGVTALEKDGEGIGLFRTEFLFMDRASAPGEEEQFQAYKKVVQTFQGKPVIIRMLDIGGDKGVGYLNMKKEDNPFLGFRAVRYCLANTQVCETQLRALIRASAFGKLKIMIPLVTTVTEVAMIRDRITEICREFDKNRVEYSQEISVGVMIETPAACMIADLLADAADFFSIGTNDLTQYIMAADRGNGQVSYLNKPYDPAVLRAIQHIIQCGKKSGIPVGVCGEAAADPLLTPLFLSFGLEEFSVSPSSVLATRRNIGKWSLAEAEEIAQQAMAFTNAVEVEAFLEQSRR